jgi:c-di-GMP-related signal transduction protein
VKFILCGTHSLFWASVKCRWVRLIATLGAGQGKSSELVLSGLVRARFCELLAPKVPQGSSDLFLMGVALADGCDSGNSHD